ncbi:MAG: hypothetical protein AAGD25_08740 [Cyanobacteria bacterium P01_F01_bin.150]
MIQVKSEQQIVQQGLEVLFANMKPSEVTRFWAACQLGSGNYLSVKDDLFEQESVDSLFTKILDYQESKAAE